MDVKTAFDQAAWHFILETCKFVGLGSHVMAWTSTLYKNQSAKLKINGFLSGSLFITNGTRQGCPLSPLLLVGVQRLKHLIRGWLFFHKKFFKMTWSLPSCVGKIGTGIVLNRYKVVYEVRKTFLAMPSGLPMKH